MDPWRYGSTDPYNQMRMRELKKREELESSQAEQQATRPQVNKTSLESRNVSRSNKNGTEDQDRTPSPGPSSSHRPEKKSFYTSQGAYGPGHVTSYGTDGVLDGVGRGDTSKHVNPMSSNGEGSSGRRGSRGGLLGAGKQKESALGSKNGGFIGSQSTRPGYGGTSSRRQSSRGGGSTGSDDRPQPEAGGNEDQARRSRG
ncbi:hypothetical protein CERZMDRAFT_93142 [Cercospora zeae-maydis SCOH1-5]|uniref:Uncharacterized protein n=1 Tax=Cercospora zeae-maydis SCOH1-5 TaxID=717836 RepID=A0A6A6FUM1_9PEZI|nr:hypothetical protein CERZMDRAFT_93142 [Cercospora zeae-maydis SCOH1-5]